jgi:hypothetical protein
MTDQYEFPFCGNNNDIQFAEIINHTYISSIDDSRMFQASISYLIEY